MAATLHRFGRDKLLPVVMPGRGLIYCLSRAHEAGAAKPVRQRVMMVVTGARRRRCNGKYAYG